jgi:hypothetical protein
LVSSPIPSAVGCDDFALADLLRPALTVIARDETQIGRTALDMYRERAANPSGPARTIVMPTTLTAIATLRSEKSKRLSRTRTAYSGRSIPSSRRRLCTDFWRLLPVLR